MRKIFLVFILFTVCSISHARLTLNDPLSEAGQNANWHTQACSSDGSLICLTGVSNYILDGKRYDAEFHYGMLSEWKPELLSLDPNPGTFTNIEISPFSLIADAAGYLYANWNLDFLLQNSAVKATFANPDLSYISDHVVNLAGITWSSSNSGWIFGEHHTHNLTLTGSWADSIPYYLDGESGPFLGPNFNYANTEQFWVVTQVSNVPLPASAWLFASALLGLFIKRRWQST